MERYEKYKDSGIEWIGEIPENWNTVRLKYRGESIIGIIYSPSDVTTEDNGILVLRSSNIQDGKLAFEDCLYVAKEVQEKHLTKEGDILLCARNGSAHLVGKSAFIPKEWEGVSFGAFMSIVRTDLGKFLYYFFNSQIFKAQTGLFSTSTINQLTADTLNNMSITIPATEEEQIAIATYLDSKTTEIDELIADKKRLLELYEEEKTAIINRAVTKGIKPDTPLKDSGIEWLGEIPEHWQVLPIKYTGRVQTGRTPKITGADVDCFQNGTVNWFTPGDFNGNELLKDSKRKLIQEVFESNQVELFPELSIYLVSIGATLGKVSLSSKPASANQQINIISFHANVINPYFGYYFLAGNKEMVLNEADYTTLPILNQTKLKNVLIAFPSVEEQTDIINHIEVELDRLTLKKNKTIKLIDLLTEYRTALISEVVTGKIKVTE